MGDTGLSDEAASARVSNHGILPNSNIANAILEEQASKSTFCDKDDQNSCNTATVLSGLDNLSVCYTSNIVGEPDQHISNVSGLGNQPSCNSGTYPGLHDQPSCNVPMVANLSDVSSSDTDDFEDTEELDNDGIVFIFCSAEIN